jgi:hypothetical protein
VLYWELNAMALKSIPLYLLKHWRGELSLATSFWINIVALNLLALGLIDPFINYYPVIDLTFGLAWSINPLGFLFPGDPTLHARIFIIWSAFKLVVLYPWQFVGLMRTCNRYVVGRDEIFWANIVQFLIIVGIVGVVANTKQLLDFTLNLDPSINLVELLFSENVMLIGVIWFVLKLTILFPWRSVGLIRSHDRHVVGGNKIFWASPAKFLAVIGFVGMAVNTIQLWPDYRDNYKIGFVEDWSLQDYQVELIKDNTFIHLKGTIGYGVSKGVNKLLRQHSGIKGIILDSMGGWAQEGLKLSNSVRLYDLDTYVLRECYSACTTVFISGKKRFLGKGGLLGFHQAGSIWSSDSRMHQDYHEISLKDLRERHLMIFDGQGINLKISDKANNTPFDDMWYPAVSELIEAGVVHEIINPSDLIPSSKIFLGIYLDENLQVFWVQPSSIGDRIKIQEDDVLIQWDDVKLDSRDDFDGQHEKINFGDPYRIKIRRNNSVLELKGILH